jgi:IS5 family transposase
MERPSAPINQIMALLFLKHIYNLSDEVIVNRWIKNPYWQYFSETNVFQTKKIFDPTGFIHFSNSTVQEKNIIYPTDVKLHKRTIDNGQHNSH